jgi:primosomal protein N' (replication factor Y)
MTAIIQVALDVPLPRLFDYAVADASPQDVGRLVRVPFGRKEKIGLVMGVCTHSDVAPDKLKTGTLLRDGPILPPDWLALCSFCARYYQYPLGQVIGFALPPLLRQGRWPRLAPGEACLQADHRTVPDVPPLLLPEQSRALTAIAAVTGFAVFLLHGITGSGKTEVYLRAISEVLSRQGQALVLLPEIALTPQFEQRMAQRFVHARIVVAHSGLSGPRRARGFLDSLAGDVDIVLGTRLAVFMPLPRLQLIVVDEEHDASFKQQEGLRYGARDLAIYRAKTRDIPIILGSATPSLESWHHAQCGRYHLLALKQRARARSLPRVILVDTRREKLQEGLSASLWQAIDARLARQEQSLIFLNRRGYAPVLACPACTWVSRCHRCAANLVVHLTDRRLRCHHCGLETAIPPACPDCGNQDIHPFGRGTQRLETTLQARFPQARLLRVDRDSARTPHKWAAMLASVHSGEADILVGTQMMAKGHDFERLTLVGVLGADCALFAADFRAPERLFAQLAQVGGRSGRASLPGEVMIQTDYPDHPLYQSLMRHDYHGFATTQLEERRVAGFPPLTFQAVLRAQAGDMSQSLAFLSQARQIALTLSGQTVTLYDPIPMRLTRLMNWERAQLLVESTHRPQLQQFLSLWDSALRALRPPVGLRWHLDVDPMET